MISDLTRTERRILKLAETQGMKCGYCGKGVHLRLPTTRNKKTNEAHAKRKATIEHVRPRTLGGTNTGNNVIIACAKCNGKKGGRAPKGKETHIKRLENPLRREPLIRLCC